MDTGEMIAEGNAVFSARSPLSSPSCPDRCFACTRQQVYCCGFNQDASCVAVGTSRGFSILQCEPFQRSHHESLGGVGIVEMLYCTSLIAIVGAGDQAGFSPRRLKIWNSKSRSSIYEVAFVTKILAIRLNRRRLVVCLETSMYIFDLDTMKKLQDMDTPSNPRGVVALSPCDTPSYLAYPADEDGVLILHDAIGLRMVNKIAAHKNKLAAMAFNLDGNFLATASEQGTVIRVFTVPTGERLYTLRRGRSPCTIFSLAFNPAATRLAVSSDKGTVHVFQLGPGAMEGQSPLTSASSMEEAFSVASSASVSGVHRQSSDCARRLSGGGGTGGLGGGTGSGSGLGESAQHIVSSYLPKRISDAVEGARSFAQARIRDSVGPNVCALIHGKPEPSSSAASWPMGGGISVDVKEREREILLVVTAEGYMFQFGVDTVHGGQCRLEKEHLLKDDNAEAVRARFLQDSRAPPPPPPSLTQSSSASSGGRGGGFTQPHVRRASSVEERRQAAERRGHSSFSLESAEL